MISKGGAYRGCLLGLAVGDAMGYSVDTKTWPQIQADYGPNGLLGYDLVNGYADVTSHTQLAAFTCNGLLLGLTRGQVYGKMAPYVRYAGLAQQEWAIGQRRYGQPQRNHCWVFRVPELRRRRCTDTRMVETLNRGKLGSLEEPVNKYDTPASIAAAAAVGLFADPNRLEPEEIDRLGAECVALTHGSPLAFLAGGAAAHLINRCLLEPDTPLAELVEETLTSLNNQFGREYAQTGDVIALVRQAMAMTRDYTILPVDAMERLKCDTGAEVLAGAVYAVTSRINDAKKAAEEARKEQEEFKRSITELDEASAGYCANEVDRLRPERGGGRPDGRHSGRPDGRGSPAGILSGMSGNCPGSAGDGR